MNAIRTGLALLILSLATSATAQDEMDSVLTQEAWRVSDKLWSDGRGRDQNYLGRPTAATYEMELQMDHIDEQMAREDAARLDFIQSQLSSRRAARREAKRQAEQQSARRNLKRWPRKTRLTLTARTNGSMSSMRDLSSSSARAKPDPRRLPSNARRA